ncbi:MAG TPA: hypothetical protein VK563_12210 [Puia sp.]|nr:hypothetical protein [Puia sp.]
MNLLISLILSFYSPAVLYSASGSFAAGKITDTVVCQSDPSQSYALYIPAKGNKEALPVIYFFDPHADGALPLRKYRMLAETYGFILIGSNNSKNGNDWAVTENIWRNLSSDVQGRLNIDHSRIYTCGFSGGAKVASYMAIQHPGVKGVIANGAGLPDGVSAGDFSFSFTAIAGEGDMNLTELVAITKGLDKTRTRHRIILFDGKHEWAPANTMGKAFAGWQFDAMRDGLIPKDRTFISGYMVKSKSRVEVFARTSQLIKAEEECRLSSAFLDGLTPDVAWFKAKAASLAGNAQFLKERQARESLLAKEENIRAEYTQHFQQGDMNYWTRTIAGLKTQAASGSTEKAMYQRLLAYLSLAFYSISNQLINGNENKGARHFIELYKMADPANSEAWYFSAILDARENHVQAAEGDLLKAVENGFRDRARLMRQVEFQQLSPRINFSRIESKMRGPVKGG